MENKKQNTLSWHLRKNPPKKKGEYLCRAVYEHSPDKPHYHVLAWIEEADVPHFVNETEGAVRVTHWAEINEPEENMKEKTEYCYIDSHITKAVLDTVEVLML